LGCVLLVEHKLLSIVQLLLTVRDRFKKIKMANTTALEEKLRNIGQQFPEIKLHRSLIRVKTPRYAFDIDHVEDVDYFESDKYKVAVSMWTRCSYVTSDYEETGESLSQYTTTREPTFHHTTIRIDYKKKDGSGKVRGFSRSHCLKYGKNRRLVSQIVIGHNYLGADFIESSVETSWRNDSGDKVSIEEYDLDELSRSLEGIDRRYLTSEKNGIKCVVLEVTDGADYKKVLVAGEDDWHHQITRNYEAKLPSWLKVNQVFGGGRIHRKTIRQGLDYINLTGTSKTYGSVPKDIKMEVIDDYHG